MLRAKTALSHDEDIYMTIDPSSIFLSNGLYTHARARV